jgi:hypothetical protein
MAMISCNRPAAVKIFSCALLLSTLAACQTPVTPYVPPSSPENAKFLLRASVPTTMGYGLYTYEDSHSCRNSQRIAIGNTNSGNKSSELRGGQLATLKYIAADRSRACIIVFSFYPKARHTYLLATTQTSAGCAIRLLDATDGDNPKLEKSYVRRTLRGNECLPISQTAKSEPESSESFGLPGMTNDSRSGPDQLNDFKDLLPAK